MVGEKREGRSKLPAANHRFSSEGARRQHPLQSNHDISLSTSVRGIVRTHRTSCGQMCLMSCPVWVSSF